MVIAQLVPHFGVGRFSSPVEFAILPVLITVLDARITASDFRVVDSASPLTNWSQFCMFSTTLLPIDMQIYQLLPGRWFKHIIIGALRSEEFKHVALLHKILKSHSSQLVKIGIFTKSLQWHTRHKLCILKQLRMVRIKTQVVQNKVHDIFISKCESSLHEFMGVFSLLLQEMHLSKQEEICITTNWFPDAHHSLFKLPQITIDLALFY
ncbi:hypothetical protein EGR_08581 [Echinococcus granulosus]|uniref:Uncharacterized protein n=1 Tax=Echinococcus granulosus TaxID=6210 RepID=W6U610_ECHGR|nr:hypothetical protein EGR_08581 [Echinococcus granulosus]EUB56555.1 hypothetical protein EGR_08581 [Echinococcus granulosus]